MANLPPPTPQYFTSGQIAGPTITTFGYHGELVVVSDAGEVRINWKAAEETVADPNADRTALAYARMLLAARDGTWKPLEDRK